MYQLTLEQFNSIHKDFKGKTPEGKREAFNASVRSRAGLKGWGDKTGTAILVEGIDFEIKG